VEYLDKQKTPFLMDGFDHFFPAFHLLAGVEVSGTREWLSSLSPSYTFGQHKAGSRSLTIALCMKFSRNACFNIATLPSQSCQNNSVSECVLTELKLITPVFFHSE
jgi:hypothetical protein